MEDNRISGISMSAGGNNIATYNGGYAQHIMMMNNSIDNVWGGDREEMTYDNAGGAFFGRLSHSSSASPVVTAAGDRIPLNRTGTTNSANGGGWVLEGGALVVLNGSGAGQIRRLVPAPTPARRGSGRSTRRCRRTRPTRSCRSCPSAAGTSSIGTG